MVEDIIGVVLLLDALEKRIQVAGTPVELRPEVVLEHVDVGVVDVAAFVESLQRLCAVFGAGVFAYRSVKMSRIHWIWPASCAGSPPAMN